MQVGVATALLPWQNPWCCIALVQDVWWAWDEEAVQRSLSLCKLCLKSIYTETKKRLSINNSHSCQSLLLTHDKT